MELGVALKRVGATIAKEKIHEAADGKGQAVATFYLRIDLEQGNKWSELVSELLLSAEGKKFTLDVSKYFYASQGAVNYLWRVVITGDVQAGMALWGSAALRVAIAHAPEITSIPLVGRARYEFDPARGKLKGGHDMDQAAGLIGLASAGGGAS